MHFDLKKSSIVFTKTVEQLCAPDPVPQSLLKLGIDITDYPNLMQDIIEMVGSDVNADLASEMSLKCHIYASYISAVLARIEEWSGLVRADRENLKADLMNNVGGCCPQAGLEKSDTAKERVAWLNPKLRILADDRVMAKAIAEYFKRMYDGLVRAHYIYKAIVERETQARKSQPNDNMPNDIPETNP